MMIYQQLGQLLMLHTLNMEGKQCLNSHYTNSQKCWLCERLILVILRKVLSILVCNVLVIILYMSTNL